MSARSWMLAQARRRTAPPLDAALLTSRGFGYAASRLKLPISRAVLRAALHGSELWLLGQVMPYEFLIPLFAMRAAPALLSGLHWGALEGLRERVRHDALGSRQGRAVVAIEGWLAISSLAAILLTLSVLTLVNMQQSTELGPWGLYGAFALVVSWSSALELWARTFHSGIFALGRVYRPAWSVVLPELTELGCLLLLWRFLGPFSLHVGVLLTALLKAGLGYVYVARAYRARTLPVPHPLRLRAIKHVGWSDLKAGALGTFASVPLQLDRLLLLALLGASPAVPTDLPLSAPYYALRPVAGLSQSWARVFYADLVRLEHSSVGVLRARFERVLMRVAALMAVISCLLLALGSYALFDLQGMLASLWFLPLAIVRGLFAVQQVRAFVFGSHARLITTGLVVAVGLTMSMMLGTSDRATLIMLSLLLLAAVLGFRGVKSKVSQRHLERSRYVSLSVWLAAISREQRPLRISVARVDSAVCPTGAALSSIARTLPQGQIARSGRAFILWWEPLATALTTPAIAKASGCSIVDLKRVEADSGGSALAKALSSQILPTELIRALQAPDGSDSDASLEAICKQLMPTAMRITLSQTDSRLSALGARDLIRIRRAIMASAREQGHVPRWARFQAAAFAPAGEVWLAFVWTSDQGTGSALKRILRHASWRSSVRLSAKSPPDGVRDHGV